MDTRRSRAAPAVPPPLSATARRRYALMRWLPLAAITFGCLFSVRPALWWPGLPALAGLLLAYAALVHVQYRNRDCGAEGEVLAMDPRLYLLLSAALIFAMMLAPEAVTNGQSLWYGIAYFVVLGEAGRHLPTARALGVLIALCVGLIASAVLIVVPAQDRLLVSAQFLPLYAGLVASALGARIQRSQEVEHAERLALLGELERSRSELEEANHQLRVYAGMVEQLAVANERTRMARDLHDILGYTLATVVVKAEAAKRLLAADPARALDELDRVQEVARGGLAEVRRSVSGLRDAATGPGVWHEAMACFVEEFGQQAGLLVEQRIDPLPEGHETDLEVCIFRVIQESLTNVARHAQARRVAITLAVGAAIELSIEDDGVGAGPAASLGGFGLRGMRERVELLGGQLVFSSRIGTGSRVLATLPLAPADVPRPAEAADLASDARGDTRAPQPAAAQAEG